MPVLRAFMEEVALPVTEEGPVVVLVVVFGELVDVGKVFGREDEGLAVDAGFEGVHGGSGLACDRGGASGFLGIAAVSFYLTESRHWWLRGGQADPWGDPGGYARARPALRIEEGFRRFGGQYL